MDRYTVERRLGEGAFGLTFLAKQKVDGQIYVLKQLKLVGASPKEQQFVKNEVDILSSLDHVNIVRYKESFEHNGYLFIVMEYADGGDFDTAIARHKEKKTKIPEAQVSRWLAQMCLALKHMHDRKVLHRDLKATNVFLTRDGVIKLGDFGLSRTLDGTYDQVHTLVGTPYYYSPELAAQQPYNAKSDIWALGCILVNLTTFNHAFPAKTREELFRMIKEAPLPEINGYSPELVSLIHRMLSRDPRARPGANALICHPYVSAQLQVMSHTLTSNMTRISARLASMARKFGATAPVAPAPVAAPPARAGAGLTLQTGVSPPATAADGADSDHEYEDDFFDHEELFEMSDDDVDEDLAGAPEPARDDRARNSQLLDASQVRRGTLTGHFIGKLFTFIDPRQRMLDAIKPLVLEDVDPTDSDWLEGK